MSGDVVMRTVALGKQYTIGGVREKSATLRDALVRAAGRPLERLRHPGAATHYSETMWALRDVNLEIRQGDAVGIIGRNGAGKSTLLKVLSHITEPTEGRVEVRGRVGSLLEVGTGFHAELTGRENVYLNGAILGMRSNEIRRKFDDIVDFAEIGRFLDTPVKRYSSGMYVRLAFAVAAFLEPEILIVDEVLAVGDASFQKKCLGQMEDVAARGRTVLLVSHNMQAIRMLCDKAIQIEDGRVSNAGPADDVVSSYVAEQATGGSSVSWPNGKGPGDAELRLTSVAVRGLNGEAAGTFWTDAPLEVVMEFDLARTDDALCVGFDLAAGDGTVVLRSYQTDAAQESWPELARGQNRLACTLPAGFLNDGRYYVLPRVGLHCVRWIVHGDSAVSFEVHRHPGDSPYAVTQRPGVVAPALGWRRW